LAEVVSGSSPESAIRHVKEEKSRNVDLRLSVASEGPLMHSRKRKLSDDDSAVFYIDNNDTDVKRKKCEMYSPI
jgi:hypothetical protein